MYDITASFNSLNLKQLVLIVEYWTIFHNEKVLSRPMLF